MRQTSEGDMFEGLKEARRCRQMAKGGEATVEGGHPVVQDLKHQVYPKHDFIKWLFEGYF